MRLNMTLLLFSCILTEFYILIFFLYYSYVKISFMILLIGMLTMYVRIPKRRNTGRLNSATRCFRCVCAFILLHSIECKYKKDKCAFLKHHSSFIYFRRKFVVWRVGGNSCRPSVSQALCFLLRVKVNQSWCRLINKFCVARLVSNPTVAYFDFFLLILEIRGGRGVPGVTRAESRCPGVDEGEEGSSPERRASQGSAGQTASSIQTLSQCPALWATPRILQPDSRGAQEGAAAEVQTPLRCCTIIHQSNKTNQWNTLCNPVV